MHKRARICRKCTARLIFGKSLEHSLSAQKHTTSLPRPIQSFLIKLQTSKAEDALTGEVFFDTDELDVVGEADDTGVLLGGVLFPGLETVGIAVGLNPGKFSLGAPGIEVLGTINGFKPGGAAIPNGFPPSKGCLKSSSL